MLFPLGTSCKVRESIQRYLNVDSLKTNIFDWVFTNFESILYFIENIDTPFKEEDFYDANEICLDSRKVNHKFIRFDTLHDFSIYNSYEDGMELFLNKYNRRLKRLKETIMNNTTIDFIHLVDVNYNHRTPDEQLYIPNVEQIHKFFELIQKINNNCDFNLHILLPPEYCKFYNCNFIIHEDYIHNLKINDNVYIHFMYQDEEVDPVEHQCRHWSWMDVYHFINHIRTFNH